MSTEQEELTIFQQGEILGAWKCGTSIQKISETLQYSQSTIKDVISSYENVKNDELEKPCEKCELVITKYKWCEICQLMKMNKVYKNLSCDNEIISKFIQENFLNTTSFYNDDMITFEYISYNQFNNIKELNKKNHFIITYSAMWSDGPLRYNFENMKGTRKSNEMVTLKYFHNSKNMINEFLNKVILYVMMNENNKNELHLKIYGISQDPNTNEYIMIMQEYQDEKYGKRYENMEDEWCILCQMYDIKINSTSWTSGDEEIDELISEFTQEIQLKIIKSCDTIFEWIPYNRFINIKEVGKGHFMTIYSAIWKDGPLHYDLKSVKGTRKSNKNVTLKCYYNSHDKINKILEKVKTYPINRINGTLGISQNPYTKDYVIVFQGDYCERCDEEYSGIILNWCKSCYKNDLKMNFINWTSGNEDIDNFIQEIQLNFDDIISRDSSFQWIPYNEFYNIKEKNDDKVLSYSATWKDGPLSYYDSKDKNIIRDSNEKVTLKYLSDTQNIINEFLSKVNFINIYGITQNPNTKDYFIVFQDEYCEKCNEKYMNVIDKWCNPCQKTYLKMNFIKWTSGNEKIDNYIQEIQLKFAIFELDVLYYNDNRKALIKVILKCLHNSQYMIDEFLNEVELYSMNQFNNNFGIYGISQDPKTKDYIMILETIYCEKCGKQYPDIINEWCKSCQIEDLKLNFMNWTSKNKIIDYLIQGIQLRMVNIVFEWIPYDQFNDIKQIKKSTNNLDNVNIYSSDEVAIWKDGPLNYNRFQKELIRESNKKVVLKYLHNLLVQNVQDAKELTTEIANYSVNEDNNVTLKIYGISQHPNTKDYILVIQNGFCENCGRKYLRKDECCGYCRTDYLKENYKNWTSENEVIDKFIQEIQLESYNIIEWIPYSQFDNVKELNQDEIYTTYLAIWKDGPLSYKMEFTRESNKKVILNRICNSQNTIDEFFYKVNKTHTGILCGISQDPDTNDYIMVFQDGYCEKCGKECTNLNYKRCKSCQIHYLKLNMPNWVSENEQINDFIQNVQLNFNNISYDLLFQWIPYNEFYDVKEIEKIGNDDFDKIYSAIYFAIKKVSSVISTRIPTRITLKSLNNSQNMIDEFLIKVKTNIIDNNFKVYGISQNPNTKDYIMVLQASFCTICGYQHENISDQKWKSCQINYVKPNLISKSEQIDKFIQEIQLKINNSSDVIFEWIAYDQFYNIKEIRNDLSIALWKNGPLQYDIHKRKFSRNKYKKVALKYLQDMIDKDKIMKYIDNNTKDNKIYGISQNSDTKDYIMVFENKYCIECNKQYVDIEDEWCKSCRINEIEKFTNWTENEKIDNLIRELRLKINRSSDIIFEWIPYDQFSDIEEIGEGGFAKVYSAIWKRPTKTIANNNDIIYSTESEDEKVTVALKCIYNSQNITNEFLNEIKAYSIESSFFSSGILRIYGISQNPDTKEYIIVFEYAEGGDLIHWININFKNFEWSYKIEVLSSIIYSLGKIHQNQMVHRDFHPGNILFKDTFTSFYRYNTECNIRISDMGLCSLCEEVGKTDESKLCGVMPYMAPEVLRSNPYTQAADIYSFGMIMYVIATGKQPFSDRAHDLYLALDICEDGIRPKIKEQEAPRCYIDLMEKCLDANPDNRPNAIEIQESFKLFKEQQQYEIEGQFKEADKYKEIEAFIKRNQHPQAIYISRVLNLDFSISQPIYEPQNSIDVKHI